LTRTAFLDRDGTINVRPPEGGYVTRPEALELLPRAAKAIARLNAAGCRAIVVTNQRGVALGRMSEEDLGAVHGRLEAELGRAGARLDGIYACTHDEGACDCRKPAIGLFERARGHDPGIEFADAVVIGDSSRDMEAASTLGCGRVLLADPAQGSGRAGLTIDHVAASLWDAVEWVLGRRPTT
jgi:D-glycero-D-manno-heptose 1,7-bisphosphate phosphatase